jgi:hypothetical protein
MEGMMQVRLRREACRDGEYVSFSCGRSFPHGHLVELQSVNGLRGHKWRIDVKEDKEVI